jgi:hypothetical protein
MRARVLALVAAAVLGAQPAQAYQAATSGVEIVVTLLSANLWEITLESDQPITSGRWDLHQGFASMAYTAAPPCDGIVAICSQFDQSQTQLPALIFDLNVLNPTHATIFTGVGNPVSLGQLTTTGPLIAGVFPVSSGSPGPDFGIDAATAVFGVAGFNPGPALLTFVVVGPEPIPAIDPRGAALLAAFIVGGALILVTRVRRRGT